MSNSSGKFSGLSHDQARTLLRELAVLRGEIAELRQGLRVLDRRKTGTIRPRPGDMVRASAGDVVVLPHPRVSAGRTVTVLVESQPVTVKAEAGTVNDAASVVVTNLGAMVWNCTGTEWWGTAVGGSSGGGGSTPLTYAAPVSVALANVEGVATSVARSDHVHRDRIDTGSADGFLSRRVYVNAASTKVGTTFMGVTVQAAPASFTSMSDFADGGRFRIGLAASGGSGACGARGTATACAGSNPAGGGGAFREMWLSRAQLVTLLAAGAITVAVGLGGASVTGPSSNATSYTACTQGNNGSGPTTFGPWSCFQGGGANGGGASSSARAGGAGGGWLSAGGGGTTGTASTTGGAPLPIAAVQNPTTSTNTALFGGGGCIAPAGTTGGTGNPSFFAGAAGSSNAATADNPRNGGDSEHGAAGGGCGGFANGGGGGDGGAGGLTGGRSARAAAGTNASGAGARTGTNGAPGANATDVWRGCGDGGAGGGGAASSNAAATGGNGGAGGFPGGGGGGAGTASCQAAAQTSTGGNSGAGGDGLLIIESYA